MVKVTMLFVLLVAVQALGTNSTTTAAQAINSLGVDRLARAARPDQNALLSPYSIQCSATALAGAGYDADDAVGERLWRSTPLFSPR